MNKPRNDLWKVQKHFSDGKVTVTPARRQSTTGTNNFTEDAPASRTQLLTISLRALASTNLVINQKKNRFFERKSYSYPPAEGGAKVKGANGITGEKPEGGHRLCRIATLNVA